jgi:hypothetical protein
VPALLLLAVFVVIVVGGAGSFICTEAEAAAGGPDRRGQASRPLAPRADRTYCRPSFEMHHTPSADRRRIQRRTCRPRSPATGGRFPARRSRATPLPARSSQTVPKFKSYRCTRNSLNFLTKRTHMRSFMESVV